MSDEKSSARRPHQFEGSWQPHPEKSGDEHERYEEICSVCGLTIVDPTDEHPVDDYEVVVKALTAEWLAMMGYPEECAPKQKKKRPYAPPTLRVLDPHEVIRKLSAALTLAEGGGLRVSPPPRSDASTIERPAKWSEE